MRKMTVLMGTVALAIIKVWAQVEPNALQWLNRSFEAYSKLESLQSKTELVVLMMTPRNPQGEPIQRLTYGYTLKRPAMLNLLVKDYNRTGDAQRYLCDGQRLQGGGQNLQVGNSGLALLELMPSLDIVPTYDMVFVFGGNSSQEKFRKQITQLSVAKEDEKQVVLKGRIKNERNREDELEIVLEKNDLLMRQMRITTKAKIEGSESAFVLQVSFEPTPNPPTNEQNFTGNP